MNQINYSIIIPNKNLTNELSRCLNSIPKRDDTEIIIIDDNSDPSIVDFNNYPGINEGNVKIIFSKTGKGAGAARNEGLMTAQGKWIIFIDSDDFLLPCADSLMNEYLDSSYDIIYFLPDSVFNDSLLPAHRHEDKCNSTKKLKNNNNKLDFYLRYQYTEPWGKFIKKELINKYKITFQESLVANDFMFSVQTGFHANNIYFDNTQLYCVTVREGSLCFSQHDNKAKVLSRLQVCSDVQDFAIKHNISIRPLYLFVANTFFHYPNSIKLVKKYCYENKMSYHKILLSSLYNSLKVHLKQLL